MLWLTVLPCAFWHPSYSAVNPAFVSLDPDGGFLVTTNDNPLEEGTDGVLVRMNSEGDTLWSRRFPQSGITPPMGSGWVGADVSGGYYWGLANWDAGLMVTRLLRLGSDSGAGYHATLPEQIELFQNYPNPFNASTAIRFNLAPSMFVNLKVYDILGREVAVLINGVLPVGRHQTTFDASHLASGIYIYRLQCGSQTQSRKMVVLK
jgi:hypothetical protein